MRSWIDVNLLLVALSALAVVVLLNLRAITGLVASASSGALSLLREAAHILGMPV